MKRILAAVDDSPRAPDVVARALELARLSGASVRLYHAVAIPPNFPPAAATHTGDPLPTYLAKAASERLHALVSQVHDVPCDVVVEESHRAAHAVVEAAARFDADLIVIGSHGYELVDRLVGTTAARVVNTSTRDVLVVHGRRA